MKKTKRILALIGVLLLVLMYAGTLIFALIDNSKSMGLFKASVACTILVPVILYAYSMFYRLSRQNDRQKTDSGDADSANMDSANVISAGADSADINSTVADSAGADSAGVNSAGADSAGVNSIGADSAGVNSIGADSDDTVSKVPPKS